ncbi:MAG: putative ATP-dependent helicase [Satyrvirus sp.]|uniref:Putative ATP-dependent helicase n=1 Tax=Satyrvirus sp. TaxID=2487771 RepID=A0A3G5AIR8_9VIRU|nr:MAG: putative ATP-dependent helicase [Satyrvirus sp.]
MSERKGGPRAEDCIRNPQSRTAPPGPRAEDCIHNPQSRTAPPGPRAEDYIHNPQSRTAPPGPRAEDCIHNPQSRTAPPGPIRGPPSYPSSSSSSNLVRGPPSYPSSSSSSNLVRGPPSYQSSSSSSDQTTSERKGGPRAESRTAPPGPRAESQTAPPGPRAESRTAPPGPRAESQTAPPGPIRKPPPNQNPSSSSSSDQTNQESGRGRTKIPGKEYQPDARITKLPIAPHLEEIINAIGKSDITIISSNTGSGKTVGVPNRLLQDPEKYIFCSLPTRASVLLMFDFQSSMFSKQNIVGYSCEGDVYYDNSTKLVYCTTGHLLNKMVHAISEIAKGKKYTWFCNTLILDEFHTRSQDSDLCLCLWIYAYKLYKEESTNIPPPKLVIMSATLDDKVKDILPTKPCIINCKTSSHEVEVVYDKESAEFAPSSEERYTRASDVAYSFFMKKYPGTYLIFVPGKIELDLVIQNLKKKFPENTTIIPAHSELEADDLKKIHDPCEFGVQKIVVATNIAECSITIPETSLVIDTFTHREACEMDGDLSLSLTWISQSNSMQRKGRTGRTCSGTYVILQSKKFYDEQPFNIKPEIQKSSISYNILKLVKNNLDPEKILYPVLDISVIQQNVSLLKKLGFIDQKNQVTDMGDFCSGFPLGIRKSAMLYHLAKENGPYNFIYLATICTINCYSNSLFYRPKKRQGEDQSSYIQRIDEVREDFQEKYAGYSDVDTILNIWIAMFTEIVKFNPFYIDPIYKYSRKNNLNFHCLKEASILMKQCLPAAYRLKFETVFDDGRFAKFGDTEKRIFSEKFLNLSKLTHPEYEAKFMYREMLCNGLQHRIERNSVHRMDPNFHESCDGGAHYALKRFSKVNNGKILRFITIIHCIKPEKTTSESDEDVNDSGKNIIFWKY